VPLIPYADTLMLTRGALRTMIPPSDAGGDRAARLGRPEHPQGDLSNEEIAVDIEDALRLNASALAVQRLRRRRARDEVDPQPDAPGRRGQPLRRAGARRHRGRQGDGARRQVLPPRHPHLRRARRALREDLSTVEDGFETVTSCCPVPIVIAGGKKLPELEALTMAANAVQRGASGVDMGRNIFQSEAPEAMLRAVRAVVHDGASPAEAYDLYRQLAGE
jgi:putative autoinducer-2 (AI-2) aldolase